MRALYRIDTSGPALTGSLRQRAYDYLARESDRFGLANDLDDLDLVDIQETPSSSHVVFQQTLQGVPVYNRQIKVNLDAQGQPTMVLSAYAPELRSVTSFQTQPALSSEVARSTIESLLNAPSVRATQPQLVAYIDEAVPRLAWQIIAWPETPAVELELLIDARDGSLLHAQNLSTHLHEPEESSPKPPARRPSTTASARNATQQAPSSVTGSGFVFDPDPLSSSGLFYGDSFSDSNDGDNQDLNDQRVEVNLLDITLDTDGLHRLNGPFVQIVPESSGGTVVYTPPAEASADGFRYTRSDDFFEAVNVYYHIDKSQRYLQSLDVGRDIQNQPVPVNPHGLGLEDNSRYFSNQNYLAFGAGGVDDAEDALVVWHEYGHALLQGSAPGLLRGTEGQALHEGWADYWAASYARSLTDEGIVARDDWETLFKWDSGDGSIWAGRALTSSGKYPDDTFCDEGGFQCDIYLDGTLWASTLMQIYDVLGRAVTDRLNLASHAYLLHPVTFRDAAEAILQADTDLYDGEHVDFLIQAFNARGLIDLASFGPLASHENITATEQLGGSLPIQVEAIGISAPVERVFAVYTHSSNEPDTTFLSSSSGDVFEGSLPLPSTPGTVTYYVIVEDELGLQVRLPASNTDPIYTFETGPDSNPPTIQHTTLGSIALIDWPATIIAAVDDNLGIDTVTVDYFIDGFLGNRIQEGQFGLTLDTGRYKGSFPVSVDDLEPGSVVNYAITARDKSIAGNQTRFPDEGTFTFSIIIENGVFRSYDLENDQEGFVADAPWQRGAPAYGVRVAQSGNAVWATNLEAAYPQTARRSSIEIPPINLEGLPQAYLVFWHWYDIEHDGEAFPESAPETVIWDGANVKISEDDGETWSLLTPISGYNGTIATGRENPMEGEPAFGGYSYGWRQVMIPIPTSDIRIRFDFGTDGSNTESALSFAGWYIDDIAILADLPDDTEAPEADLLPEAVAVRDAGQPPPAPFLEVTDDTGIASVFADFQTYTQSGNQQGRVRLAMDPSRKVAFTTDSFLDDLSTSFAVGDSITFRLTVSDFSGNTRLYPAAQEAPYRIEYRLRETINVLERTQATGLWKPVNDGWAVVRRPDHETLSSLVFDPFDLPTNVDNLQLLLFYQHQLTATHGGNLKLSTDGGATWNVVRPTGGYNAVLPADETIPASMQNQEVFTGQRPNLQQAQFDLLPWRGQQVRLRIDFAAQSELSTQEFWRIQEASLAYSTLELAQNGGFDVPLDFALHANFPDPFSSLTTISYTLSEASPVSLEVYDILGRRIEVLVDENQPAGSHTINYDGSALSNGLYLLRLSTSLGQKVERMVVSR